MYENAIKETEEKQIKKERMWHDKDQNEEKKEIKETRND